MVGALPIQNSTFLILNTADMQLIGITPFWASVIQYNPSYYITPAVPNVA